MFKSGELEAVSMALEPQFAALEERIMTDIVRRIKINGEITRAADWQITRLAQLGQSKKAINEYVYNKETLGFRLDAAEEIAMYLDPNAKAPTKEIKSFFNYTKALVTTLIDFQNNVHLHSDDWHRTVYINSLGISATDFDISDKKKTDLVESGRKYAKDYLDWYNNDEEKANK